MVLDDHEHSHVLFHSLDSLSHHNALFTMALEAKYNVTQTAIDSIVSSTSILLNHLKQDVARYVVLRIPPTRSFVSNLYISQHSLPENGSQTNLNHRALHKSL